MKKVTFIQKVVPHYRLPFFNQLREKLLAEDIQINLLYGKSKTKDSLKKEEVEIEWAKSYDNKVINFGTKYVVWQPVLKELKDSDLVIVEQANKLILNYLLMLKRPFHKQKLGYWGHGLNLQIGKDDIRNKFKGIFIRQSDWWFAYTDKVKSSIASSSFSEERITTVQNAIDTQKLREDFNNINEGEISEIRSKLNITSSNVAIYCGGIYKEKRIDFLINSCEEIKKQIEDFHIIFIGGGEDAHKVKSFAEGKNWAHYMGPLFGREKVKHFKVANAFLMPGLVGLAILDTFALETPMITTKFPFHSPEIDYLEDGENGLMSEDNLDNYTKTVIEYFQNPPIQEKLKRGCNNSYSKYTIEQMVDNFAEGISKCLNQ